jgi:hypothetical protein
LDIVIAVLVLAAALAALAYPMYRTRVQAVALNASTLDDLLAQRDGVYATLRDLELDRQLGKLDATDYNALREKYMTRATEVLQELDALRGEGETQEASAEIEKEIAALRRRGTGDGGRRTGDERRLGDEGRAREDGRLTANDERPSASGRQVPKGPLTASNAKPKPSELQCGNCGRPYDAGDKFCARCGHALG